MSKPLIVCSVLGTCGAAALLWWFSSPRQPEQPGAVGPAAAPAGREASARPADAPRGAPAAGPDANAGPSDGAAPRTDSQHAAPGSAQGTEPAVPARGWARIASSAGGEPAPSEPIVAESLARSALQMLGKDPAAEAVWLRAINDPALSRRARTDLIEDVADTGFSEPITRKDLPLVEARMRLLERLTPLAMDDVNAVAFGEAYKDLVATLARLGGSTR